MTTHSWIAVTSHGSSLDQFGRALWNLLAPLHGEPPCYALGEQPWPTLDLADTDAITGLLPRTNLAVRAEALDRISLLETRRRMVEASFLRDKAGLPPLLKAHTT